MSCTLLGLIAPAGCGTPPPSPLRRGVLACHRPTWPPPRPQYFGASGAAPGGAHFAHISLHSRVSQFPTFAMAQDKACAPELLLHGNRSGAGIPAPSRRLACLCLPAPTCCLPDLHQASARCRASSASTWASGRSATSTSAGRLAPSFRGARHSFRCKGTATCQPFWSSSRLATKGPTQWSS